MPYHTPESPFDEFTVRLPDGTVLTVRPLKLTDAKALSDFRKNNDRFGLHDPFWRDGGPVSSLEKIRSVISGIREQITAGRSLSVAAWDGDRIVAWFSFRLGPDETAPTWAEIGYAVDLEYEGRGVITNIGFLSIWPGFRKYNLLRVWAKMDPRNDASIRTAEALDLRLAAVPSELADEVPAGMLYYELREENFRAY